MTPQDIILISRKLIPYVLFIGILIIEIINAIRAKDFFIILLFREFTKMIIAIIREIKGKEWGGRFNAIACLFPCVIILATLCIFIRAIFIDINQLIVSSGVIIVFGFIFYWTFKVSTNFLDWKYILMLFSHYCFGQGIYYCPVFISLLLFLYGWQGPRSWAYTAGRGCIIRNSKLHDPAIQKAESWSSR